VDATASRPLRGPGRPRPRSHARRAPGPGPLPPAPALQAPLRAVISQVLLFRGHVHEALAEAEAAVAALDAFCRPLHPSLLPALARRAEAALRCGDFDAAARDVDRALALAERLYGGKHPAVFEALSIRAAIRLERGVLNDAYADLVAAVEGISKFYCVGFTAVAPVFLRLATFAREALGAVETSNNLVQRAIKIVSPMLEPMGSLAPATWEHPVYAEFILEHALNNEAHNMIPSAARDAAHALRLARKRFAGEWAIADGDCQATGRDTATATTTAPSSRPLPGLARFEVAAARTAAKMAQDGTSSTRDGLAAMEAYLAAARRAVEERSAEVGPRTYLVAEAQREVGRALFARGDVRGASDEFDAAHALLAAHFGADHVRCVAAMHFDLAQVKIADGDVKAACALAEEAVSVLEAATKPDPAMTIWAHRLLADDAHARGDIPALVHHSQCALESVQISCGLAHPFTAAACDSFAIALDLAGDRDRAAKASSMAAQIRSDFEMGQMMMGMGMAAIPK
jgi:tetratricopeptide (TPR) repeat protein